MAAQPTGPIHATDGRQQSTFQNRFDDAVENFNNPRQIWKERHLRAIKWIGRIGWIGKALIYAIIGGLSCQMAVEGRAPSSASPQGAFILVGSNSIGVPLLVVLACCIALYAAWRYWEAITGQGTDQTFSKLKNFFKFRLSPFVSGAVYTAYAAYVCFLIPKSQDSRQEGNSGDFVDSWSKSTGGKVVLCILGIAFTAATIVQLDGTFRPSWHRDYKLDEIPNWLKWIVLVTGHIGYAARAGVFLALAVLFYKSVSTNDVVPGEGSTTVGDALGQLQQNRAGRALLFILGFGLIIYGLFATMSSYTRYFPTQPPSRIKRSATRVRSTEGVITAADVPADAAQENGAADATKGASGRRVAPDAGHGDVEMGCVQKWLFRPK